MACVPRKCRQREVPGGQNPGLNRRFQMELNSFVTKILVETSENQHAMCSPDMVYCVVSVVCVTGSVFGLHAESWFSVYSHIVTWQEYCYFSGFV